MHAFERPAPDTLRIERLLDASVETVWRWIADPELRKLWFAGGSAPKAGGDVELLFDHDNLSADPVPYPAEYAQWQGAVARERIVLIEPPHRLVFTWDEGREELVTFELTPEGARTRLVLTHCGISGPPALANAGGGWLSHLAVLEAKLAGHAVSDFWALHRDCEAEVRATLA
jgi:uncharacterized protein YndB with AHSA1/START domain